MSDPVRILDQCVWPIVNLGDIAAPIDGAIAIGPFGSAMKADSYVSSGVSVVRGTNISDTRSWKGDWVYISEQFAQGMPRCCVSPGDLLFPHRGSIGEIAIVPDDGKTYFLSSSMMKATLNKSVADPLFVYYYFRSPAGRAEILRFSSQVGTPGIGQPLTSLRQFRLPLPSLSEQKATATVLASLDDKIDLNRRTNETLEAMARALFRDWFVEFGPTRAKMEGRPPYLAPDLWSIFPDRLDEDGKPEGWDLGTLGQIARTTGTAATPSDLPTDTPYIGLEHMPKRSLTLDGWETAEKVTSGKTAFKRGDLLFGKLRPYFHKVGIAPVDGVCSTDIVALNATEPHLWSFVTCCIFQDDFVAFTDRTSDGTKMPRTSWARMASFEIVRPGDAVLRAFNDMVSPWLSRIVKTVPESHSLATLRDLLLPKLVSGEIRVKDAEGMVGEVT